MSKVFLLMSMVIAGIVIALGSENNQISSYTDGNILLRVYSHPDGTVKKREYFVNGVRTKTIEYKNGGVKIETLYDQTGEKQVVNKYVEDQLVKSTNYANSLIGKKEPVTT